MSSHSPQPGLAGNPIRVLVADDHPAVLDAVVRFLESEEDFEVAGRSPNGVQALRLIEQRQPDVALLDIRMPGLTGIDIARKLGETRSQTRVVLYTGDSDRALLMEALDIGIRGFVLKDAPLEDLSRAIHRVANGETYVDAGLTRAITGTATEHLPSLSQREREILRLLADGMRNEQVARRLSISPLTVRTHVKNAMVKLDADTRTQAVARALRESLIT